ERPDAAGALLARSVGGGNNGLGRGTAGAHDEAGALVLDLVLLEARIDDCLLHRRIIPCRTVAHEATHPAIDSRIEIERRRAMDLAAKAKARVVIGSDDAGFSFPQRGNDFLRVVSD